MNFKDKKIWYIPFFITLFLATITAYFSILQRELKLKVGKGTGEWVFLHYQKDNINCNTSYEIALKMPLCAKRIYNNGRTEYIIIRPIQTNKEYKKVYFLVKNSKNQFKDFETHLPKKYGSSEEETFHALLRDSVNSTEYAGIFFRGSDKKELFLGMVSAYFLPMIKRKKKCICVAYWVGDPNYTEIKGIGTISLHIWIDYLIERLKNTKKNYPRFDEIALIINKKNKRSINLAKKTNFIQNNAVNYFNEKNFPFYGSPKQHFFYHIDTENWKKKNKRCNQTTKLN